MAQKVKYNPSNDAGLLGKPVAKLGGQKRAESLTPKERTKIAQKAANTRWKGK